MQAEEAYDHVIRSCPADPGRFYEPGNRLALGKGCIYRDAVFATFDDDKGRYRTAQGEVYVLTHECDVDADNARLFNSDVLVCPLTSLQLVVANLELFLGQDQLVSFLTNLGARNISRLAYLPPIVDLFPFGSVMYLNQITHAPAQRLKDQSPFVCALSGYGLRDVEYVLENHLLRPKADRLAYIPEQAHFQT